MTFLEIIFCVGALAIGLIVGMVVEMMIDNAVLIDLERDNQRLKLELEQSRKEPEIIEITDPWAVSSKVPETVSFPHNDGF